MWASGAGERAELRGGVATDAAEQARAKSCARRVLHGALKARAHETPHKAQTYMRMRTQADYALGASNDEGKHPRVTGGSLLSTAVSSGVPRRQARRGRRVSTSLAHLARWLDETRVVAGHARRGRDRASEGHAPALRVEAARQKVAQMRGVNKRPMS
eukprot:3853787-Pleurochrysis_carterae.AAC.2